MFRRKDIIFTLTLFVLILIVNLLELNKTFVLYGILRWVFYLLFIINFVSILVSLIRGRDKLTVLARVGSLVTTIVCAILLLASSYLLHSDGGKSRLFVMGFNHDLNSMHVQLFRDGTFKSLNAGPFGGAYIRGQYIFQKDTLEFINDSLGGLYPSKRLVLKNNGEKAKFVPTDSAKSMFSMTVHEDNRLRD